MTQHQPEPEYAPGNGEAADQAASPASGEDGVEDRARTDRPTEAAEEVTFPGDAAQEAVHDDERGPDELREALAEAERERDQYVDHLRRERAEFENFRRRSAREQLEAADRGAEQLAERLLGVLDNFHFALEAAEKSDDEALAKGVQMVHTELLSQLEAAGLEEIPGEGMPFDPEVHEAMMRVDSDEPLPQPVVVEVLRRGYRFKGRVLRPAAVKVAS